MKETECNIYLSVLQFQKNIFKIANLKAIQNLFIFGFLFCRWDNLVTSALYAQSTTV